MLENICADKPMAQEDGTSTIPHTPAMRGGLLQVRVTAKADHQLLSEASISAYKEDFQTTALPSIGRGYCGWCATDLLVLVFNGRESSLIARCCSNTAWLKSTNLHFYWRRGLQ